LAVSAWRERRPRSARIQSARSPTSGRDAVVTFDLAVPGDQPVELPFEREDRIDAAQGFDRQRRLVGLGKDKEVAPAVALASGLGDWVLAGVWHRRVRRDCASNGRSRLTDPVRRTAAVADIGPQPWLSFRRFAGLALDEALPDHSTLRRFRDELRRLELIESTSRELGHRLIRAGFCGAES
jgi:hypothetical protein